MKYMRRHEIAVGWNEWDGDGYEPDNEEATVYYTLDHVSLDDKYVLSSLALALARDGITDSRGEGYKLLENAEARTGYAGPVDGEISYTVCNTDGTTHYGNDVNDIFAVTWVEVPVIG